MLGFFALAQKHVKTRCWPSGKFVVDDVRLCRYDRHAQLIARRDAARWPFRQIETIGVATPRSGKMRRCNVFQRLVLWFFEQRNISVWFKVARITTQHDDHVWRSIILAMSAALVRLFQKLISCINCWSDSSKSNPDGCSETAPS